MEEKFEFLVQQVLNQGYGVIDNYLPHDILTALQSNLTTRYTSGQMKTAGIGNNEAFQTHEEIRKDHIYWLDESSEIKSEQYFFATVKEFITFLNSSCYSGINGQEFHYALYDEGSFYKKHLDQFKKNGSRLYSLILYLNPNWQSTDGGELIIYLPDHKTVKVEPIGGRLVFFKSDDIPHEVLKSNKQRMSLTGWLKR